MKGSVLARDLRTGKIVHISDVEDGYEHAICDVCKSRLVSSNHNRKVRRVACYFRHQSGNGGCSSMTMLHQFAQQVVYNHGAIFLPDFSATILPKNSRNGIAPFGFYQKGHLAHLSNTSLEKTYPTKKKLIADVYGNEDMVGDLYIEIRVHNEVHHEKASALNKADLDVIQIDLRTLVDKPGLTKEQIKEAVLFSSPREWLSQRRFEHEIRALREEMSALEDDRTVIRRKARASQEEKGKRKKEWRAKHEAELGLLEAYTNIGNRKRVLDQFWRWCAILERPENQTYQKLRQQCGEIPQIVNIPVKGELAFKVHRMHWQTLIFEGVM